MHQVSWLTTAIHYPFLWLLSGPGTDVCKFYNISFHSEPLNKHFPAPTPHTFSLYPRRLLFLGTPFPLPAMIARAVVIAIWVSPVGVTREGCLPTEFSTFLPHPRRLWPQGRKTRPPPGHVSAGERKEGPEHPLGPYSPSSCCTVWVSIWCHFLCGPALYSPADWWPLALSALFFFSAFVPPDP